MAAHASSGRKGPSMSAPETSPVVLRRVFLAAGGLLGFFVVSLLALVLLAGPPAQAPSGLRAPAGVVETEFGRRMAQGGHEVAYYSGLQVSVLVTESEWQALARKDRFARHRFLADAKAGLVALQRERGDKTPYVMAVRSAESRRVLAEETDFNPRFYD